MKTQAAFFLVLTGLAGHAQAGWVTPTKDLSYDTLCRLSFNAPPQRHICFVGPEDVSQVMAPKGFRGFVQPGSKTNFVLYQSDGDETASYWTSPYSVDVKWDVNGGFDSLCATYSVELNTGAHVTDGVWCPRDAPVHLPGSS